MEFNVVHKGVDSLYVSYRGSMKEGILDYLESRKQLARSDDLEEQAQAVFDISGHHFEVWAKGSGVFSYVIDDNWFRISIAGTGSKKLPALYVQIRSELLNCRGVEEAMKSLRCVVDELLVGNYEEKVSRIDIFVDFVSEFNFDSIKRESWITQAKNIQQFWDGNDFTGWSIGRRSGDILARLYDKTVELGISNKEFFKDLWRVNGWQEGQRVARLEFALKKGLLSLLGIFTVTEALEKLNDLWKMCTQEWLRLGVNNGTENRTRWETESVWGCIQGVTFNEKGYSGIKREVSRSRSPDIKRLYLNGLGYLLTYAALKGYTSTNLLEAAKNFLRDAGTYLDACVLNDDKAKKDFEDSMDYVDKKINIKKKKFNMPDSEVPF